jgi:hypothetical protein
VIYHARYRLIPEIFIEFLSYLGSLGISMSMVLQLHMIQDADNPDREVQDAFMVFDDIQFDSPEEADQKRRVCAASWAELYFFCSSLYL